MDELDHTPRKPRKVRRRAPLVALAGLLAAGTVVGLATKGANERVAPQSAPAPMLDAASGEAATMRAVGSQALSNADADVAAPAASGAGGAGGTVQPQAAPGTGDKIVKHADLTVEVGKRRFREAFDRANAVASAHGGFVVSSSSTAEDGRLASGSLVLRVPAAAFDAVRAELSRLGEVEHEALRGQDVSGQLIDLDARIKSLRAQEDALRAIMAKAVSIADTIQVQGQLTDVRRQIEDLTGQKARLDDAADRATINLHVKEVGAAAAPDDGQPRLARALDLAVEGALTVVGGTVILVGWLLPLAILAAAGWAAWAVRRRRRAGDQDAAVAPAA